MSGRRVLLFSGMGGDGRLFGRLRLGGGALSAPAHAEPLAGEDLASYAERLAQMHGVGPEDVVGGASFGGMIAAQIASTRRVAGVVLLGSCLQPRRLPGAYRWLERAGPLMPDALLGLRSWGPLLRRRFHPIGPDSERLLREMADEHPTRLIRAFGRMLMGWPGAARPSAPTLCVHGDLDVIIPLSAADPDLVLERAGHAFTLTHAAQTSAAIDAFLARLG